MISEKAWKILTAFAFGAGRKKGRAAMPAAQV
jgi:hypothetical protein